MYIVGLMILDIIHIYWYIILVLDGKLYIRDAYNYISPYIDCLNLY